MDDVNKTDNLIEDEDPGDGGPYPDHVVNGPVPEVGVTIPKRYGKSITLSITTKEPENWFKLWTHFSEMAAELGQVFPAVHLNSYDLDALGEEDEDKPTCAEEHLHHDDLTLEKFKVILLNKIAETFEVYTDTGEALVADIVNELHNNRMLIRERKPLIP